MIVWIRVAFVRKIVLEGRQYFWSDRLAWKIVLAIKRALMYGARRTRDGLQSVGGEEWREVLEEVLDACRRSGRGTPKATNLTVQSLIVDTFGAA